MKLRVPAQTWACVSLVLGAALAAQDAHAQDAGAAPATQVAAADPEPAPAAAAGVEEVIVTGTRKTGMQASDSPAPVQVLSAETLKSAGPSDLIGSLAAMVPSFTAQAFGGDMANQTLSAKLRGLSPNHALILVNGKRRHTTANFAVLSGPYQGASSADLNFIPTSAIDHIEVLTDGAAAQYGTDAIAGVINIILKKDYQGGLVDGTYGGYKDGGGETTDISGNVGFGSDSRNYFNLTAEVRNHAGSDRGGADPRALDADTLSSYPNSNMTLVAGYPYLNHIIGDPEYHSQIAMFNGGMALGSVDAYTFGSYGKKKAESFENYRVPSKAAYTDDDDVTTYYYPFGFNPQEATDENDLSLTVGLKGTVFETWNWDLSSTYGKDRVEIYTLNSLNTDLYADTGASPTDFYDGAYVATQWTNTLDIGRDFDVGLASPLNVALGLEQRSDSYELEVGDPASRYESGASSFPGIQTGDAGKHTRDNVAAYVDFALSPIDALQLDAAVRYEHFTDFGSTTVGKLTGRYDFSPAIALRGTVSTGFRAPTLAEEYYSATNVGPSSAFVQMAPNAAAASLLGLGDGLKPEKSTNFSFGVVLHPIDKLTTTIDAYQIEVRDRIVGSGALYSVNNGVDVTGAEAITAAIVANGNTLDSSVETIGINIFANGLSTRTRGVDLVMSYPMTLAWGNLDWTLSGNYNETEVTKIKDSPSELGGQSLYDRTAISDLETASPKYRINLAALWTYGKYSIKLSETLYGPSSEWVASDDVDSDGISVYYKNRISATPITDLELAFKPVKSVKVSLGANNLFNTYPDKVNSDLMASYVSALDTSAVTQYPTFSPFGFNGAYYYGKVSYSF
ncbi:MAG: TonB-dependent receptor [Solimonas sp.]